MALPVAETAWPQVVPSARVLVVIPTYNEIENLPNLVDEVLRVLPDADLLVVDDNSPDGTGKWCDAKAQSEPRLRCLHRAGKMGLGSATLEAARIAIDEGYDVFITLDADWSHDFRTLLDAERLSDATEPQDPGAPAVIFFTSDLNHTVNGSFVVAYHLNDSST